MDTLSTENLDIDNINYSYDIEDVSDDLSIEDQRDLLAIENYESLLKFRDDLEECEQIYRKHLAKHSIPLDITALDDRANGRVFTNLRAYGPNMIRLRWASNSVVKMMHRYLGVIRELKKYLRLKRD